MNWILWVVSLVFVVVISGLLGLTAGINLNPESTVRYVPNWGSVGDWVSGTGALLAVLVTLWLADKQRKDSLPKIEISQSVDTQGITIEIVSSGDRSAMVWGMYLRSQKHGHQARLARRDEFPKRLEFGDKHHIFIPGIQYVNYRSIISGSDECEFPDLEVVVETSMKTFSVRVDRDIIEVLEGHLSIIPIDSPTYP